MTPSNIAKGLANAGQRMTAASKRIFALKEIGPGAAIAAQRLLAAARLDLNLLEGKLKGKTVAKAPGKPVAKASAKSKPASKKNDTKEAASKA